MCSLQRVRFIRERLCNVRGREERSHRPQLTKPKAAYLDHRSAVGRVAVARQSSRMNNDARLWADATGKKGGGPGDLSGPGVSLTLSPAARRDHRKALSHVQNISCATPSPTTYTVPLTPGLHTLTRRYGQWTRGALEPPNMDKRTRDLKSDYLLADKIQTKEVQTAASLWEGPTR